MTIETATSLSPEAAHPEVPPLHMATREQWQDNIANRQGIARDGRSSNVLEPERTPEAAQHPAADMDAVDQELSTTHKWYKETFWEEYKVKFAQGLFLGTNLRYIPHSVASRIVPALESTGVGLVDPRVMNAKIGAGASASYSPAEDRIRLRLNANPSRYELDTAHELYHKLSGGTFVTNPEVTDYVERWRGGYTNVPEKGNTLSTHLNLDEAIIHQLALGTLTRDFETLDPDERFDGNRDQYIRRKVVAIFVNESHGIIDVKTLTNAVFEDSGVEGSTGLRRQLVKEAVTAYGWGALRRLETLCNYAYSGLTDNIDDKGRKVLQEEILNRIHPPQFDEAGNIVGLGTIDVEGIHF